jgi:UDP-glucose 4-epimerase
MRVLVTGGFGYLGGRVARKLVEQGHQVVLGSRRKRLAPDYYPHQAIVIQMNWDERASLEDACKDIDVVIHTAGMNAQECENNPKQALKINGENTEYLVKAAIKQRVKQFIYFSTAHVYASPLTGCFDERSPVINTHPYATSHLAGEKAIFNIPDTARIDARILRISNAFGAPINKKVNCWMLLVNDLCKQSVTKNKLVLNSDGELQIDFITITDLSIIIGEMIIDITKGQRVIANIGTNVSYTIFEMAQMIQNCYFDLWKVDCQITKKKIAKNKDVEKLNYKTNYLHENNYSIKGDFKEEVKKLLHFCKDNFA